MNSLATAIEGLGDFRAARKLHEEALECLRRVQGEEHPDTLISMSSLALSLRVLGKTDAANELITGALPAIARLPKHHSCRVAFERIWGDG